MTTRQFVSQRRWHLMGPVLPGGTIYSLVLSPNREQHNPLLAGTPVGVFRSLSRGANWSWANRGLTGLQVAALASSVNGVVFLGTLDGVLARSVDGGYSWACLPPIEGSGSITSIAVSPDYLNDGTILIGAEEGGIFRSTDSGRSTKPANFGLADLSVLALATAPGWPKSPVAFAGTTDGLYRSTNGGRAWRAVRGEIEGLPVQAIAVSPRFERDGTAYAATEEDGLFRSRDGGSTWHGIGAGIPDRTLNCLWVSPRFAESKTVLAGTSTSGVYRSTDGGDTWQQVLDTGNAVLALAGDDISVFAGFHNAGANVSNDAGQSWEPCQEGLHANALTSLATTDGETLFAAGPDTGVFVAGAAADWQLVGALPEMAGIAAFAAAPANGAAALTVADVQAGLHLSRDGGGSWCLATPEAVTALAAARNADGRLTIWAGTRDGRLLTGDGSDWAESAPFAGQAVLRLEASAAVAEDGILVAATREEGDPSAPLSIWRSRDAGATWQALVGEEVRLPHVNLAIDHRNGGRLLIALDRHLLIEGEGNWQRISFGQGEPPVLAVAVRYTPTGYAYIVGTTIGVFISDDTVDWQPLMRGMGYAPILAFAPVTAGEDDDLWALGLGGLIWRWTAAKA